MNPGGKKFTVYRSSAGSGKTFTLVKEYLRIVLSDPDSFRNVLAITFTNKAANEMKERIIRYLKAIADPASHPDASVDKYLLPDLIGSTGIKEADIRLRASLALKLIMHHYSDFAVSTIDSFFHRIVRTFAYDLNIPVSFEVVLEEDEVLTDVVRLLLDSLGTDDELTRVLLKFVQSKAEDERHWDIERDLVEFSEVLVKESSLPYLDQVAEMTIPQMEEARKILWEFVRSIEKTLATLAGEWLDLLERNGLDETTMAGGRRGMIPWLHKIQDLNYTKPEVPSWLIKAMEKGDWSASKATTAEKDAIQAISGELERYARRLTKLIGENGSRYLSAKILLRYIYPMAVLGALDRELQTYKRENNILLISEFNRRIHEVVSDQPAPFIFERIGEKYRHFMVDEFQDTSILQWHNILPLVENSLAEGHPNLVVGDGKQAIYRFRSGDVRQFEMLPSLVGTPDDPLVRAREQALVRNYQPKVLEKNFRSAQEVVKLNNELFRKISEWWQDELMPVYQGVEQRIASGLKGSVTIQFAELQNEDDNLHDWTHKQVLATVNELLEKGFKQNDICILCRDNKNASEIAAMLLSHGKQVISADSLVLSFSAEVNFLIAWMKYLSNPHDEISLTHILIYLMSQRLISRDDVEDISLDPDIPDRWTAAKERAEYLYNKFRELLHDNFPYFSMDKLLRLDLFHLTVELMRQFTDLSQPDPYLQFFQDQLLDLLKKDKQSLFDAIEWWEDKGRLKSISTPEGLDAIRVMTVHKSKGLEFPVVIFPFAVSRVKLTHESAWVQVIDRELKEKLPVAYIKILKALEESEYDEVYTLEYSRSVVDLVNIFYVAMTRARDHLFVFTSKPPDKVIPTDSIPRMLKRFLEEIGLWQEGTLTYEFGEITGKSAPVTPEQAAAGSIMPVAGGFSDWKERVLLKMTAPEHWEVVDPESSYAFGNKIHYILSMIKYPGDLSGALNKSILEGVIDSDEYEQIRRVLEEILSDEKYNWLYDASYDVRNEAELIRANGDVLRPDRLMFRDKESIVVDYKTGKRLEKHMDQVRMYSDIIHQMGWEVTGAYVLYLGKEKGLVNALKV